MTRTPIPTIDLDGAVVVITRGHIVNVASTDGMIPIPGMVTYNGSKFAALGLSLAARREYAQPVSR
jgi:short-subunit dehydrogenase